MNLVVITEQDGRRWYANCYEEDAQGAVGNAGPKRSEAAAASGAIGNFFKRNSSEGRDPWDQELESPPPRPELLKLTIEIKERDGKFLGKCREDGWSKPVGMSGVRSTQLSAAKRSLGNFFHVRTR